MVVIRLARTGRRNLPLYRITVADGKYCRDGRYLANVGWYNPKQDDAAKRVTLDLPTIEEWIKKGAQPSPTVKKIIKDYRKSQQ